MKNCIACTYNIQNKKKWLKETFVDDSDFICVSVACIMYNKHKTTIPYYIVN